MEVRSKYGTTRWSPNSETGGGARWWGRGGWGREEPDVLVRELSAVLNLERRLPDAVRVAELGDACGTRARALPLILDLGELHTELSPEASYPGAES